MLSMAEQTKFDVGWGEETFLCIGPILVMSVFAYGRLHHLPLHVSCGDKLLSWNKEIESKNSKQS